MDTPHKKSIQLPDGNNLINMPQLVDDLKIIINSAKVRVASAANAKLTMMY